MTEILHGWEYFIHIRSTWKCRRKGRKNRLRHSTWCVMGYGSRRLVHYMWRGCCAIASMRSKKALISYSKNCSSFYWTSFDFCAWTRKIDLSIFHFRFIDSLHSRAERPRHHYWSHCWRIHWAYCSRRKSRFVATRNRSQGSTNQYIDFSLFTCCRSFGIVRRTVERADTPSVYSEEQFGWWRRWHHWSRWAEVRGR